MADPILQSRTEAVQPSLWDRLVDDLPGIVAETDRQRADLVARLGAAKVDAAVSGGAHVIEGDPELDADVRRDLHLFLTQMARRAFLEERGIVVNAQVLRDAVRRDIEALFNVDGDRAEALLDKLGGSADPLVRIRAAQGLVASRGHEAIPRLLAAAADAAASGAWRREHSVGGWANEQLRKPQDALTTPPFETRRTGRWPKELETMTVPAAAGAVEPMNTWARMRSPNPDVRRDAIEAAHELALTARDPSVILALVAAERFHAAVLARADVSQYTVRGSCSRVNVTNYWSSWIKLARIPFDPMYKYTYVTWNHLAAHAAEVAPQQVPPELADLLTIEAVEVAAAAIPDQRLRFTSAELAAWDAEEQAVIG